MAWYLVTSSNCYKNRKEFVSRDICEDGRTWGCGAVGVCYFQWLHLRSGLAEKEGTWIAETSPCLPQHSAEWQRDDTFRFRRYHHFGCLVRVVVVRWGSICERYWNNACVVLKLSTKSSACGAKVLFFTGRVTWAVAWFRNSDERNYMSLYFTCLQCSQ